MQHFFIDFYQKMCDKAADVPFRHSFIRERDYRYIYDRYNILRIPFPAYICYNMHRKDFT